MEGDPPTAEALLRTRHRLEDTDEAGREDEGIAPREEGPTGVPKMKPRSEVVALRVHWSILARMRPALALALLVLAACDAPSASSLAAYRDAQKSGLARVAEQEKALAQSITAIRAGQWVPRPDLGACTATLPPPPAEKDHAAVYPAWVVDDPARWGDLVDRVFRSTQEWLSVGPSGPIPPPDTQKAVVADTARFAGVDPRNADDFAILLVDDLHRPKETGPDTFEGATSAGAHGSSARRKARSSARAPSSRARRPRCS